MKCPACNSQLKEFTVNNVRLDACNVGCGGVWFDNHELKKFDEAHEPVMDLVIEPQANIKRNPAPLSCPKCSNIKLFQRFSSVKRHVEVDECAGCGGIWLDSGEMSSLRNEFKSEEDRKKAASDLFKDMFSKDLKAQREKYQDARSISNAMKFMSPSWYLKGKSKA